jgi:hypothetical protein
MLASSPGLNAILATGVGIDFVLNSRTGLEYKHINPAVFMMSPFEAPDPELLKTLLEPMLDDFQYWLNRAQMLLENEDIYFLSTNAQADLLARVGQVQQEVQVAQSLFRALGGQAGVDAAVVMGWHKLVAECWRVMIRFQLEQAKSTGTL